jgi:hypothetical protein
VLNTEKSKPSIIAILITDIVLLLIVLIGLLRLLHDSGGSFAIGRLLWNQVGPGRSHIAVFRFTYLFPLPKGVIWLLIATVAEVPPTVCPVSFLVCFFFLQHLVNVAGIHRIESERYCRFRFSISVKDKMD